jgi:tetratricopeptide (TPR) repeat protein
MQKPDFKFSKSGVLLKFSVACLLIFIINFGAFAQYRGAPVKKDRLLKALRSKQLQTADIVTIINRNGVDFRLTPELRRALIAAGARPEIIRAVEENPRLSSDATNRRGKRSAQNYEDLLDQAIFSYKDRKNPAAAVRFLESAVKLSPKDPKAFQMLGYVNLYGLNNPARAEKYMRQAIENGGSAVFRVYHDDNGNFMRRCTGSLYISSNGVRYESDDNMHTFETTLGNVEKIKLDRESSKIWKKHPIYKVFLKIGDAEAKFRFAPVTGKEFETKMAARMFIESQLNRRPVRTPVNFIP